MDNSLIERMARLRGIGDAFHDYRGELRYFSIQTKTGILRAMGCAVDDEAALANELSVLEVSRGQLLLPPIATAHSPRIGVDINVPARDFGASLSWTVMLEDGSDREGVISSAECHEIWRGDVAGSWITRRRLEIPVDLPNGYHELEVKLAGAAARCSLVIAPSQCFEPAAIVGGKRMWGIAVQLYTVRSRLNWGMGDFGDLKQLIRWLAPRGAGFIGLNPMHALAPADPNRASPYSASSRHFLNVLYISIVEIPEFRECQKATDRVEQEEFTTRLNELRAADLVDYSGVAAAKFEILQILFRDFADRHLRRDSARAQEYRSFVAAGGALLQTHAQFDALDHHFRTTLALPSGWLSWPAQYRDINGDAVRRFVAASAERIEFHVYLQWLAHEQLAAAQALARDHNMPLGLYGDYAVGANPGGSETWVDQHSYRMGAEIGAPPDPLALRGQGWGIPPQDPFIMETQRLLGFVRLVRNNMRYYGSLRLDHVMSLFRLWWVAAGSAPTEGAYVHYPLEKLLAVLALESARASCLVVGEDLGVVPDEMRRAMPEYGLYHYKVLLFENQGGRFKQPDEFIRRALGTVTTHDMPTLRSYWDGLDVQLRQRLNLYPSPEVHVEILQARAREKMALLDALRQQGLQPERPASPADPFTPDLARALHVFLARSPTVLVALQIEDLLGMVDPVNVPGTDREYPNWQRKLSVDIEDMVSRGDFEATFAAVSQARGG